MTAPGAGSILSLSLLSFFLASCGCGDDQGDHDSPPADPAGGSAGSDGGSGGSGNLGGSGNAGGSSGGGGDERYPIGGVVVSGAMYVDLILNGGEPQSFAPNHGFTFDEWLDDGTAYEVRWAGNAEDFYCRVDNGVGTVRSAPVTDVLVTCEYGWTIGGQVSGLRGVLVLQNNGQHDLTLTADGPFRLFGGSWDDPYWSQSTGDGLPYLVTVHTHPDGQLCTVSNGAGLTIGEPVEGVLVECTDIPDGHYAVGGSISGLLSTVELDLEYGGTHVLGVFADGTFRFPQPVPDGTDFTVTVSTQPTGPAQSCAVRSGTGRVSGANEDTVQIDCTTDEFVIGGDVAGLQPGDSITLQLSGGGNVVVDQDGPFAFAPLADGSAFEITVAAAPAGTTCAVSGGAGVLAGSDLGQVRVACLRLLRATAVPANTTFFDSFFIRDVLSFSRAYSTLSFELSLPTETPIDPGNVTLSGGLAIDTVESGGESGGIAFTLVDIPEPYQTFTASFSGVTSAARFGWLPLPAAQNPIPFRAYGLHLSDVRPTAPNALEWTISGFDGVSGETVSVLGPGGPQIIDRGYTPDWVVLDSPMTELGAYTLLIENGLDHSYGFALERPGNSYAFAGFHLGVVGVAPPDPTGPHQVCLEFDVELDPTSAEDPTSYTIPGRTVQSATLGGCGDSDRFVRLTTDQPFARCPGNLPACHRVTAAGVSDASLGYVVHPVRNTAHFDATLPNGVDRVVLRDADTLVVYFHGAVEQTSADDVSNYSVSGTTVIAAKRGDLGSLGSAECGTNLACVELTLGDLLVRSASHSLDVGGVQDASGGCLLQGEPCRIHSAPDSLRFSGTNVFRLQSAQWLGPTDVALEFTEVVDATAAEDLCNYASSSLDLSGATATATGPSVVLGNVVRPPDAWSADITVNPPTRAAGCSAAPLVHVAGSPTVQLYAGPSDVILLELSAGVARPEDPSVTFVTTAGAPVQAHRLFDPDPRRVLLVPPDVGQGWVPLPAGTHTLAIRNLRDATRTVGLWDTVTVEVP